MANYNELQGVVTRQAEQLSVKVELRILDGCWSAAVYIIVTCELENYGLNWVFERHFNEFLEFYQKIQDENPSKTLPPPPPSVMAPRMFSNFMSERRQAVEICLRAIANNSEYWEDVKVRNFFCYKRAEPSYRRELHWISKQADLIMNSSNSEDYRLDAQLKRKKEELERSYNEQLKEELKKAEKAAKEREQILQTACEENIKNAKKQWDLNHQKEWTEWREVAKALCIDPSRRDFPMLKERVAHIQQLQIDFQKSAIQTKIQYEQREDKLRIALKKEIDALKAENKRLRKSAAETPTTASLPSEDATEDREQEESSAPGGEEETRSQLEDNKKQEEDEQETPKLHTPVGSSGPPSASRPLEDNSDQAPNASTFTVSDLTKKATGGMGLGNNKTQMNTRASPEGKTRILATPANNFATVPSKIEVTGFRNVSVGTRHSMDGNMYGAISPARGRAANLGMSLGQNSAFTAQRNLPLGAWKPATMMQAKTANLEKKPLIEEPEKTLGRALQSPTVDAIQSPPPTSARSSSACAPRMAL